MRTNRFDRTTAEPTRVEDILTRARAVLNTEPIQKTIWGSPAGKKRLAKRLAALLPAHTTYVEPFAGSAAVFFAKEPVETEVLNDADPEIVEAFRILKKLKPDQLGRLRRMKWVGDENTFHRLIKTHPKNDVEKLHRFLYLSHFSYGKMRGKSFSPSGKGAEALTVERIVKFAPRLKSVRSPTGCTPRSIKRACALLVLQWLHPLGSDVSMDQRNRWRVIAERTRDQSVSFERAGKSEPLFGDWEIDSILRRYRKPMGMGSV